jgi:hypothetical protein
MRRVLMLAIIIAGFAAPANAEHGPPHRVVNIIGIGPLIAAIRPSHLTQPDTSKPYGKTFSHSQFP